MLHTSGRLEQVLLAAFQLMPQPQQGGLRCGAPCQGPVRVPGLERYMAAKQRARQLAEEQQAREAKAFLQNPKARLEPCTVPQPFALQTELREVRLFPSNGLQNYDVKQHAEPGFSEQQCGSQCCGMRHRHIIARSKQVEMRRAWLYTIYRTTLPAFPYPSVGCLWGCDALQLETANRRAQLQARILAASMRECTFQPKTNESINRELLKAIIEDSDVDPLESIASASTV